jgi:PAS domain S-box-containing protein
MRDKMNEQIEYIGRKIKEKSRNLAQNITASIGEESFNSPVSLLTPNENLFIHIGDFLISQNEKEKYTLKAYIELLSLQLINSKAPLDQSSDFIYQTRCSIMDFLQLELSQQNISLNSFFEVIKLIEYVYQLISKTLLKYYNDELTFAKYALDLSNEDLQMTLKELADLERVLNEATIFSITDRDDKISYANDNFCNLYKYTREELIGKKHDIFRTDYHPPTFFNEIWETIQAGDVWKGEILNQAKDGTKYWLDTSIVPFVDYNGKRYQHISIQYDITEKRKTEETLRNTEKLAMIGELAAGIAHEIRNPLTTIRGFVQLLTENGLGRDYANTIIDEIERINFIVSEFMVFARPHQIYFSDCDIKSILTSVIKFLEPEAVLKNVIIDYIVPIEEVIVSGEKNQLKQVFLNLIKNAIEAMPTGGKIYVSIERTAHTILITIKDHGVGMESEQIKKLGEPFFTTKDNGNGLGLMVSYKIIQNHKGTIHVESQLNQGTTFIISFEDPAKK